MTPFTKLALGLAAGTMFLSSAALAAWSDAVYIKTIESGASDGSAGVAYLEFTTTPANKPACGTAGQVRLSGTADNVKSLQSVALAAFLAGKRVKVYFDGTCVAGSTYAKVPVITIQ